MKDFFAQYIPDKSWIITEDEWDMEKQNVRESQFTLGNGFIASRGILEEIPKDSKPGTFISGLFDKAGAKVSELVNLPNPITLIMNLDGEKLDIGMMKILKHSRYLNMQKGLLLRHTSFKDNQNNCIDYQSLRFVSMHDKSVIAMQVYITPMDADTIITIDSLIDLSVQNEAGVMEAKKRHFKIKEVSVSKSRNYLCISTLEKELFVGYMTSLHVKIGRKSYYAREGCVTIMLKKGETVCLTKIINMGIPKNCREALRFKEKVISLHEKTLKKGFNNLLSDHIKTWKRIWKNSDVIVKPDIEITRSLRFNIYHLLICADRWHKHNAIGARTLSGEGYRGHIFWDSDIFTLPFFVHTDPVLARNLLFYRYNRLSAARNIAKDRGFKGAMFPWESADTGYEETPPWARNLDKSIIRIYNHLREQHISADIAYAFYYYYTMTCDEDFMLKHGYEVIFEIARFWASRVEYDKKSHIYEIKHVIGPDEFHEDVNNNAFTNMLAKWTLLTAFRIFFQIKDTHPAEYRKISRKVGLAEKEVKFWERIALRIMIKRKYNVIEQFDGFFNLKKVKIKELDENFMPLFPKEISFKEVGKTQLVKQADVLMLLFLFSDVYNLRTKRSNYNFYITKTVHKSSLSQCVHSIVGAEVGDITKAYQYFLVSLNADLENKHGNTAEGIHAASLGGTWLVVIRGFAGVSPVKGILSIRPRMPRGWTSISFSMKWHGRLLRIVITEASVRIRVLSKSRAAIDIIVYNKLRRLVPGKEWIFYKRSKMQGRSLKKKRR